MSSLGRAVRSSIRYAPGLHELLQSQAFSRLIRKPIGPYWGRFPTFEKAWASIPADRSSSLDRAEVASSNIELYFGIQFFDWPVLFYLQQAMCSGKVTAVTDFGGHIGVKYLAYREALAFRPDLLWTVIELPAMIREAERRLPKDKGGLRFTERAEDSPPCDVLICSGVLAYSDLRIADIIQRLPSLPRMVILNKVATTTGASFYALEEYGGYRVPYRVCTFKELTEVRQQLGYALTGEWLVPREITVLSPEGKFPVQTIGQAWTMRA